MKIGFSRLQFFNLMIRAEESQIENKKVDEPKIHQSNHHF